MSPYLTTYDAQRVFVRGVRALDIAEPLASFDGESDAAAALDCLRRHNFVAAGVRTDGFVTHVIEREALEAAAAQAEAGAPPGSCLAHARPLSTDDLLPDTALLDAVVVQLHARTFVLVQVLGVPCGLVSRRDLEDPPVRMWLFGLLTLIEMAIVRRIEVWGDEVMWRSSLSPARLQKALELQAERRRRGLETPLLHCLPFSDKGQVVARNEALREALGFASRKRAEAIFKTLERLRNNLAHMQPVVEGDWEIILNFAQNIEPLLVRLNAASSE
ncbi:MAG: hypothetical protein ACRC1H_10440 [Caldilineaceae bacterium]